MNMLSVWRVQSTWYLYQGRRIILKETYPQELYLDAFTYIHRPTEREVPAHLEGLYQILSPSLILQVQNF